MTEQIKCQALNTKGYRCRKMPTKTLKYHGDAELYSYEGPEPVWVKVYLCKEHRQDR